MFMFLLFRQQQTVGVKVSLQRKMVQDCSHKESFLEYREW